MSNTNSSGQSTNALTNCDPNATYGSLLQIANNNTGLTGSLQTLYDGVGNSSVLQLSTSAFNVTSGFKYNGNSISIGGPFTTGAGLTFSGANAITFTTSSGTTNITIPAVTDTLVTLAASQTLTNKTLTSPVISTIINTGTLTLPTSTDTLVGRATTDTLTNKTLTSPKIGTSILDTNGNILIGITATGSAVNQLTIANAATTSDPVISATGSDSNIAINLTSKGNRNVYIGNNGIQYGNNNKGIYDPSGNTLVNFTQTSSSVNYINVTNAATTTGPIIASTGSDTNVPLVLSSKGTSGCRITGRTDGSATVAGYVGEIISSTIASGSAVSLSSGTPSNITSISLTAGNWLLYGYAVTIPASGTTSSSDLAGLSTTSATLATITIATPTVGGNNLPSSATQGTFLHLSGFTSLSSTTTYYLVYNSTFAVSTKTAYGAIWAVRVP